MRYIIPSLLFLANNEVISWLALVILMGVFMADCWKARFAE
jgi:hypothetical protein